MTKLLICAMLVASAALAAQAEDPITRNWIRQWNHVYNVGEDPNTPDTDYFEITGFVDIIIHEGIPGEPFSFEARTEEWDGLRWIDVGLGDINLIYAESNAGGIAIATEPHFDPTFGARNVGGISRGENGVLSTISSFKISGELGDPLLVPIYADVISGALCVQGDIVRDMATQWLTGSISCASLKNLSVAFETIPDFDEHTGDVTVFGPYAGTMSFVGPMRGPICIGGEMSGTIDGSADMTTITVDGDLSGSIQIGGNLSGGGIIVNGSFKQGAEIVVDGQFAGDSEFITIDYDGWDELDSWEAGASVWVDGEEYGGNTPEMRIWEVAGCKGDLDNDGRVEEDDATALWFAINSPDNYAVDFPGLVGSMAWHADVDCSDVLDEYDEYALDYLIAEGCSNCTAECQYDACRADWVPNGCVDLTDLSELLAIYGCCQIEPCFDEDADFDASYCIDLADLSFLLAVYGLPCDCRGGCGGGGDGPGGGGGGAAGAGVTVEAFNTNGFEGDGFAGESDHFVFDLTVDVLDDADDWTAAGAVVRAENGAVFRLAAEPTAVDPLASFVRAPRDGEADEPNAGTFVAGAFAPVGPLYDFEPELINLCWFDRVASSDGPAAVMRLVIDVSGVPGADTSGGFGSVYFSQSGPVALSDILVAELQSETATSADGARMSVLAGRFYVRGQ